MANAKATATSGAARPAALPDADSGVTQPAAILCEADRRLHDAPNASRETIENLYLPGDSDRSFQDVQCTQTFCQILKSMAQKTDIPSLDDEVTVWQLVWTHVAWPQGDAEELCTKKRRQTFS